MATRTARRDDAEPFSFTRPILMTSLEEQLRAKGKELGFDLLGIAPAVTPPGFSRLQQWLINGYAGEMAYMEKHREARADPNAVFPGTRSIIMAALNYHRSVPGRTSTGLTEDRGEAPWETAGPRITGRVSRYAWFPDYHELLRRRLEQLLAWLQEQVPECRGRVVVDTAPLLERDFARLAGLGWFGKNTMLLNKRLGSWFFLGAVLVNIALTPDAPHVPNHCGTCTACLEACPTEAFPQPGVLDARRCISYLTIELRKPIPVELRPKIGDWVFGCDICQDVCPWNRKAPETNDPDLEPKAEFVEPDLIAWLGLSREEFRQRFRQTALTRPRRAGLLRNVAVVLGNQRNPQALPALLRALEDEEPLVRGAAAWALGQFLRQRLAADLVKSALQAGLERETDPTVRAELLQALAGDGPPSSEPKEVQPTRLANAQET